MYVSVCVCVYVSVCVYVVNNYKTLTTYLYIWYARSGTLKRKVNQNPFTNSITVMSK